jgi:hypothetical protein
MIISLHLPKTAGTSFAKSLKAHFGSGLVKDYGDFPFNTPVYERSLNALRAAIENGERDFSKIQCIHGHFLPLKYLLLSVTQQITFVTWMRDPVERLASQYYYWLKTYNPESARSVHRKMVEEEWSLERFCLGPELQNFYAQFLWGFPLEKFAFIGIVENYDEDFAFFTGRFLGARVRSYRKNLGGGEQTLHVTDPEFRKTIEAHHSMDMDMYRRALAMRRMRETLATERR